MKSTKPRLVNSYNKPLTALANILNRHKGATLGYSFLRDEWYAEMGNKDERFAEWFDYAFSLAAFNDAAVRSYYEDGSKISYARVQVIQDVIPRGEK